MPVVDRNILRLALFELLHEPETPRPVVIDEALEIAKRFSTPKSSQFINGILDGVLKGRRGEVAVDVRRAPAALPDRRGTRVGGRGRSADELAVYRAAGPDAKLFDQYDNDGYSLAVSPRGDGRPGADRPGLRRAPLEPRPVSERSSAARPASRPRRSATPFRATLAGDATSQAEAVERILSGMASSLRYDPDRQRRQDPGSVFASRRAHCVGFSELAVDLLRRVGIPARTVQGVLRTKPGSDGYDARIGGVYHRWIEVYYPDRGFVFSDPFSSINGVDCAVRPVRAARVRAAARPDADRRRGDGPPGLSGPAPARRPRSACGPSARLPVDGRPGASGILPAPMTEKYAPGEIEGKWQRRWAEARVAYVDTVRARRRVLHAQHVPVPVGQPSPRRARAQLHPGRRALPARADGGAQGPEPDGLGRVRPAGGERGHPERRPPPRVHARQHRAHEGAAVQPRVASTTGPRSSPPAIPRTTGGTSGSSCACGSGAWRTARPRPSTGARAAGPCSPTSRSSTGAASAPTTSSRSAT